MSKHAPCENIEECAYPEPTKIMHNGNVHHRADCAAYIRPVHGVAERTPAVVYTRDVVRAYLSAAGATQVLLCDGTFERVHSFDEFEFNRCAVMFGAASRARPPWAPFARAREQIRVATEVEISERVAVAAGHPTQAQRRARIAKSGFLPKCPDADELQRVAGQQSDLVLERTSQCEYRAGELCELYGWVRGREVRAWQ